MYGYAQMTFIHALMGQGKTTDCLSFYKRLTINGKDVWLIKPAVDNRDGDKITSRIGLSERAQAVVSKDDNIVALYNELEFATPSRIPEIIIVDEAQFLTREHVNQLRMLNITRNIPIYCYGLLTDASTNLFEGSERLIAISDVVKEIEAVCTCGGRAIVNARINKDGRVVMPTQVIDIGYEDKYKPMCASCFIKNGGKF